MARHRDRERGAARGRSRAAGGAGRVGGNTRAPRGRRGRDPLLLREGHRERAARRHEVRRRMPVRDRRRQHRHPGRDRLRHRRHQRPRLLHGRGRRSCARHDPRPEPPVRPPRPVRAGGRLVVGDPGPAHAPHAGSDPRDRRARPDRTVHHREGEGVRDGVGGLRSVACARRDHRRGRDRVVRGGSPALRVHHRAHAADAGDRKA